MAHLQAQNPKIKEISYISGNRTSWLKIFEKFLIFSQEKSFRRFSEKKVFPIFPKRNPALSIPTPQKLKNTQQKQNFLAQILKKFLYIMFPKAEPSNSNIKKIPGILPNERFSYIF